MRTRMRSARRLAGLGVLLAAPLLWGATLSAQTPQPDARWQAWLGCWEPLESAEAMAPDATPGAERATVCVLPAAGANAVEVVTLVRGEITERQRLEATGERLPVQKEGCSGWESLEWAAAGQRAYQRSDYRCENGLHRRASGVMAILPSGEWVTVQGLAAGTQTAVRVLRYRPLPQSAAPSAEIARALAGSALARDAARLAAAAPLTTADVVEASRQVDEAVVEAWLGERGQGLELNAARLVELADAGVPARVTDLLIALSYPQVFAVNRATGTARFRPEETGRVSNARRPPIYVTMNPWSYGFGGWGYRYGYGYAPYGYGRYGYYGGWYTGQPTVIVVKDPSPTQPQGRLVKGRGYTQGNRGSQPPRAEGGDWGRGSSGSGGSSSSGNSGSGSSGSSGSSSSGGGERTAKPRP